MSFYSSLALFYPGEPPPMSVADVYQLATSLRATVGVSSDSPCELKFKYGDRIDQDYESTTVIEDLDESGMMGYIKEYKWDDAWESTNWEGMPATLAVDRRSVYRSYCDLGSLTEDASDSLARSSKNDPRSGIWPHGLSVHIEPFCPTTMTDSEPVCTGLIAVTFSGYGYFSWGPLWKDYATQYRMAAPVQQALKVVRNLFPVRDNNLFPRVAELLGPRFLNREYYDLGDWILTVQETG